MAPPTTTAGWLGVRSLWIFALATCAAVVVLSLWPSGGDVASVTTSAPADTMQTGGVVTGSLADAPGLLAVVQTAAAGLVSTQTPETLTFHSVSWKVAAGYNPSGLLSSPVESQIGALILDALDEGAAYGAAHGGVVVPVAWDVGMNGGLFTAMIARKGVHVYAFEPQQFCHAIVAAMVQWNGPEFGQHIHQYLAGGSDVAGGSFDVSIHTCETGFVSGKRRRSAGLFSSLSSSSSSTRAVPIVRISAILPGLDRGKALAELKGHVSVIKMDTEGAESRILPDLLPVLLAGVARHLVVEVAPHTWVGHGANVEHVLDTFVQLAAAAERTLLLIDHDMQLGVRPRPDLDNIGRVPGPFLEITDMRAFLLKDRLPKERACNIWFTFPR